MELRRASSLFKMFMGWAELLLMNANKILFDIIIDRYTNITKRSDVVVRMLDGAVISED